MKKSQIVGTAKAGAKIARECVPVSLRDDDDRRAGPLLEYRFVNAGGESYPYRAPADGLFGAVEFNILSAMRHPGGHRSVRLRKKSLVWPDDGGDSYRIIDRVLFERFEVFCGNELVVAGFMPAADLYAKTNSGTLIVRDYADFAIDPDTSEDRPAGNSLHKLMRAVHRCLRDFERTGATGAAVVPEIRRGHYVIEEHRLPQWLDEQAPEWLEGHFVWKHIMPGLAAVAALDDDPPDDIGDRRSGPMLAYELESAAGERTELRCAGGGRFRNQGELRPYFSDAGLLAAAPPGPDWYRLAGGVLFQRARVWCDSDLVAVCWYPVLRPTGIDIDGRMWAKVFQRPRLPLGMFRRLVSNRTSIAPMLLRALRDYERSGGDEPAHLLPRFDWRALSEPQDFRRPPWLVLDWHEWRIRPDLTESGRCG